MPCVLINRSKFNAARLAFAWKGCLSSFLSMLHSIGPRIRFESVRWEVYYRAGKFLERKNGSTERNVWI